MLQKYWGPFLKPSTGIGRGHGKRRKSSGKAGGKSDAKTQAELKQTKAALAQSQAELQKSQAELKELQSAYDDLMERVQQYMNSNPVPEQKRNPKYSEPTQTNFKSAYDELHRDREAVRICDLRRKLNWPHEVFDGMIRGLRDNRIIRVIRADESLMTRDELRDCFVDESKTLMGLISWYGR